MYIGLFLFFFFFDFKKTVELQHIYSNNSGMLHLLDIVFIDDGKLSSSVVVYQNASVTFPPVVIIPQNTTLAFLGLVCGIQYIHVYGTLELSDVGSTFATGGVGEYEFTTIIVYDGGQLTSVSLHFRFYIKNLFEK
jgi:hypothetical protein